jgi:catechol 2,3-dioxygenase-like lactoylglutathione lyase family enzyme
MWDHVTIRVSDREASRRFYDTVLASLRIEPARVGAEFDEWRDFSIAEADGGNPVTRNVHVGFLARSRADVDAFWRAGVDAGHRSDGEPGLRPEYDPGYYGGFLLDPDGNSAEAVFGHRPPGGENVIDHLWIRVADLETSRRFWGTVAPALGVGVRPTNEEARRFAVAGENRHFVLVRDERPRTEHVHLAFPVATDEAVAEFHRVAVGAGYRDNGSPGERPQYHHGYVGAFVLDPDGLNVEAVNHTRGPRPG